MTEDSFLMLGNAKTLTVQEIKDRISIHDYTVTEWPLYLPDLNPIGMIWKQIKDMVHRAHSELEITTSGNEQSNDK